MTTRPHIHSPVKLCFLAHQDGDTLLFRLLVVGINDHERGWKGGRGGTPKSTLARSSSSVAEQERLGVKLPYVADRCCHPVHLSRMKSKDGAGGISMLEERSSSIRQRSGDCCFEKSVDEKVYAREK